MSSGNNSTVSSQRNAFARFFKSEATSSILLLLCTIVALLWANSSRSELYFHILQTKVGVSWGDSKFQLSLHHWINDGLMTLFFFIVGLEIKREIAVGQLSSFKKAILPVAAAVGGMVVPALIYLSLNAGSEAARGWGIAMATDIAFALGILSLLGSCVPVGLKLFLTALAITDDLGAVLVIAVFYTDQIRVGALLVAVVLLALLVVAQRLRIRRAPVYAVLAVGVWLAVVMSGVHATVAGILVAMVVQVRPRIEPKKFLIIARDRIGILENSFASERTMPVREQINTIEELHLATGDVIPAGLTFEHYLHPVTAYVIIPLFALFNAGVALDAGVVSSLVNPVGLGVLIGLFIGKQVGVTIASWIAIRLRAAEMPPGVTWAQIYGAAILAGIGFTMSLFVTDLAFPSGAVVGPAKLGILAASTLAAVAGYGVLRIALRKVVKQANTP
jgi:Na+:H+ antiporter, NhaA family